MSRLQGREREEEGGREERVSRKGGGGGAREGGRVGKGGERANERSE